MKVGFVGAGRMGRPMVARLVYAGHDVRALGRTADKRRQLHELGATAVRGVTEAAAGADAVVVCVFDDDQLREVCLDAALMSAMPPGSALVVHTTAAVGTVAAIATRAHGVDVVDAAVSGGPHDIAAGRLSLFVGGACDAVARVRPVLDCYGDPVLHVGPLGAGQKVKLVNNALFAAQIGLLAESVRLGERLGVAEPVLLGALAHGSAASRVLSLVASRGSIAAFVDAVGEFVDKDVAVVRHMAGDAGADLGALDAAIEAVDAARRL
ncbi:NAD(P)-dependent oxidoreductase [Mycobacterium sp. Marseille-P9652]|uniref:NAD(P)-dependent oxidoreductase n=1 Tax=Mycobacterium sp. Marseille-P9652 TaxID=2654950 RepID=UPI0012E86C0E|nr:NAD(P)-dependent oxidoreductase [Mycobacterium sp. Marseille-P9652]